MLISHSRAWRSLLLPAVAALAFFGCDTSIDSSLRHRENPEQPPAVIGGSVALRLDAQTCIAIEANTDSLRVLVKDPAGGILSQRSVLLSRTGISLDFLDIPAGPGRLVEVVGFDRLGNIHWYGAASVDVIAGGIAQARIVLRRATGTIQVDIVLDSVDTDTTFPPVDPPEPVPLTDTVPVTIADMPSGAASLLQLEAVRVGDRIYAKMGVVSYCSPLRLAAYASPVELTIYPAPPAVIRIAAFEGAKCLETLAPQPLFPEGSLGHQAAPAFAPLLKLPVKQVTLVIELGPYAKRDIILMSGNPNDLFKIPLPRPEVEPCYGKLMEDGSCLYIDEPPPEPVHCTPLYDANGKVVDSICPVLIPHVEPVIISRAPALTNETCIRVAGDMIIRERCTDPQTLPVVDESRSCTLDASGVEVCEGSASEERAVKPLSSEILVDPTVR